MGQEIERKFLVRGDSWRGAEGKLYRQGYLSIEKERTVRVRVAGDRAMLTVKGPSRGATRSEWEYEIPVADAEAMLDLCRKPLVEKRRHRVEAGDVAFEIDEFLGANRGLIVAEVELESEDQEFERPPWLGDEVTDDPRYFNANLVEKPFSEW